MTVKQADYEELLAEYSDYLGAIALLKEFRPYLEMIPSMRRPEESVITVPLPLVRIRGAKSVATGGASEVLRLPCDVAILMCDPEWKIKMGGDILVFIHRPSEDFSNLLGRWRQTQICLNTGYEWQMPEQYQHILSEASEETYPLFVVFPETPERIKRGLRGASLPFVTQAVYSEDEFALAPGSSSE
ncbi:MAG: hypothetical protein HC781_16955 [Leptolyngbyaceae cyanobacterium CSU_1_4]|nr:hypothetical protein [Leptolyngbyaceae cyanobacterium CSU_1_4]